LVALLGCLVTARGLEEARTITREGGPARKGAQAGAAGSGHAVVDYRGLKAAAVAIFKTLDVDGDGAINMDEMGRLAHASVNEIAPSTLAVLTDNNVDGLVSESEFTAFLADQMAAAQSKKRIFGQADENEDGILRMKEFLRSDFGRDATTAGSSRCPANFHPGPADTLCKGKLKAGELNSGDELARATFMRMDRDSDAAITPEELDLYTSPDQFAAADHNGDGFLGKDEYANAPMNWRSHFGRPADLIEAEFQRMDTHGAGAVTREDYHAFLRDARLTQVNGHIQPNIEKDIRTPKGEMREDRWVAFNDLSSPLLWTPPKLQARQVWKTENPVDAYTSPPVDMHDMPSSSDSGEMVESSDYDILELRSHEVDSDETGDTRGSVQVQSGDSEGGQSSGEVPEAELWDVEELVG